MTNSQSTHLPLLVRSLLDAELAPAIFGHPVSQLRLIETHISFVVLTGTVAYKLKKNVDFGFLDFSSLQKRKFYCEEELRINRRYAEDLYLAVVAFTGSEEHPQINGAGPVLEYAVKMQEFPQRCLLGACLQRGEIHAQHIDQLAEQLAGFHSTVATFVPAPGDAQSAGADSAEDSAEGSAEGSAEDYAKDYAKDYGSQASIGAPVLQNFAQISRVEATHSFDTLLQHLRDWSENRLQRLAPTFEQRRQQGFIRECHGDLHLGNMALLGGVITFFDGIEFSQQLRWIDTQSELAYLLMDLEDKACPHWANRLCNQYLERSGDYAGLVLQQFYKVYRALVRAKVNALRLAQNDLQHDEREHCQAAFGHYIQLAERYTKVAPAFLAITCGVSGSGKTTLSMPVVEQCGAIRLRSDVERKRLHGLGAEANSQSAPGQGIYTTEASQRTFDYLAQTAAMLLRAGYPVIVDATFLEQSLRERFHRLAGQHSVPFVILHCEADTATLVARLQRRSAEAGNASEADVAILQRQLVNRDALTSAEKRLRFALGPEREFDRAALMRFLRIGQP